MNKPKGPYEGLNDILKQLDQKNNETAKNIENDVPIEDTLPSEDNSFLSIDETPVSTDTQNTPSWLTSTWSLYSEHTIENNTTSVFWCYMDYTKDNQQCVLMIYKDPTGKEKIVCASFAMDNYVQVIEKTISDLGRNTDLVYVIGGTELTLDTSEEIIELHGTNQEVWNLNDNDLALCKKIISQHLFGHGIEGITYAINEQMIDAFNGNLDNEQKAGAILMLWQQILSNQTLINNTWDETTRQQIGQKMKQQWDILTQYAQDIRIEISKDFISEMEQYIEITDHDSQLTINDHEQFTWVLMRCGLDILIRYPNIFHQ